MEGKDSDLFKGWIYTTLTIEDFNEILILVKDRNVTLLSLVGNLIMEGKDLRFI